MGYNNKKRDRARLQQVNWIEEQLAFALKIKAFKICSDTLPFIRTIEQKGRTRERENEATTIG